MKSKRTEHRAIYSDISNNPITRNCAVQHRSIVTEVKKNPRSLKMSQKSQKMNQKSQPSEADTGTGEPAPKKPSEVTKWIGLQNLAHRGSLSKRMWLLFMCFGLITLISIIAGLALFFGQRSVLQSQVEVIERKRSPPPMPEIPKVVFSAALRVGQNLTLGPYPAFHILIYKNVFTNIGNAYNQSTGIFVVPLRGVYHFSFTAFGWGEDIASGVLLHHNDQYIIANYDNNPGPGRGAINMATLQLEVGDTIYMGLSKGRRLHVTVHNYNVFNGHLLFPL